MKRGSKYYGFKNWNEKRVKFFREKEPENLGMKTWILESDNSQNGGSDGIFPHFSTPSIKNKLRVEQICRFFQIIQIIMFFRAI